MLLCAAVPAAAADAWLASPGQDAGATAGAAVVTVWRDASAAGQPLAARDASGAAVGLAVIDDRPGEPVTLALDTHGAPPYRIEPGQAAAWSPRAGIVLESRGRVDGPADTLEQARALWARGGPAQGRTFIDRIFLGINPCGETRDFASDSVGWFQAASAGTYRFATLSDDASFILVDDQPLVAWGGWHGLDGGRRGEHGMSCALARGVHKLEYLYVQNGDNPIQEVAWSTPDRAQPAVMAPGDFLPLSAWQAAPAIDAPWCSWRVAESSRAGGSCLAMVRLEAHGPGADGAAWRFDDGGSARGRVVEHAFARAGMRALEMTPGLPGARALPRRLSVHPCWTQVEEWSEDAQKRAREQLIARDALTMPWQDDLALAEDASFVGDPGWIGRIGAQVAQKPDAWGPAGAPLLASLGFLLQDGALRRYDQALACWRALLAFPGVDAALHARVALHCAGLLIHGFGQPAEAATLLAAIDPAQLSGPDPRLCTLYRGDLALALGKVEEARARYREAGDVVDVRDLGYAVRRRLRLECARSSCARGEWEQALAAMGEIEWETPMERLGTETGLLKVRAWLGRKEVPFALSCCRDMLAAVGPDPRRAEVLLALADASQAAGDHAQAVAAAKQLLADCPYSEAAARAKDRYPESLR